MASEDDIFLDSDKLRDWLAHSGVSRDAIGTLEMYEAMEDWTLADLSMALPDYLALMHTIPEGEMELDGDKETLRKLLGVSAYLPMLRSFPYLGRVGQSLSSGDLPGAIKTATQGQKNDACLHVVEQRLKLLLRLNLLGRIFSPERREKMLIIAMNQGGEV